jgi:hypothetical protein
VLSADRGEYPIEKYHLAELQRINADRHFLYEWDVYFDGHPSFTKSYKLDPVFLDNSRAQLTELIFRVPRSAEMALVQRTPF